MCVVQAVAFIHYKNSQKVWSVCTLSCDIPFFGYEESTGWLHKEAIKYWTGTTAQLLSHFFSVPFLYFPLSFFPFSVCVNIPDMHFHLHAHAQGGDSEVSWHLAFVFWKAGSLKEINDHDLQLESSTMLSEHDRSNKPPLYDVDL